MDKWGWHKAREAAAKTLSALFSTHCAWLKALAGWVLFFLATYLLLWLALIPTLGRKIAERELAKILDRPVVIEVLRVNPLTLNIYIEGFQITDKDGGLLFEFARFKAELLPLELLAGVLAVKNLMLDSPRARISRAESGVLNIADLLPAPSQDQAATSFQFPTGLPLHLENISMTGGRFDFEDKLKQTAHSITDLNFSLPLLSTRHDAAGNKLSTRGAVNAAPVAVTVALKLGADATTIAVDGSIRSFKFRRYAAYLPEAQTIDLDVDEVQATAEAVFANAAAALPAVRATLHVRGVEVRDKAGEPFFRLASLAVEDIALAPVTHAARVGRVALAAPWLRLRRLANGAFQLPGYAADKSAVTSTVAFVDDTATALALASSSTPRAVTCDAAHAAAGRATLVVAKVVADAVTAAALPSLPLAVAAIELTDGQALVESADPKTPPLQLEKIQLAVRGLDLAAWKFDGYEISAAAPGGPGVGLFASLRLTGDAALSPLRVQASLELKDLSLERLAGLAPEWKDRAAAAGLPGVNALAGAVDLRAETQMTIANGKPSLAIRGVDLQLNGLKLEIAGAPQSLARFHLAGATADSDSGLYALTDLSLEELSLNLTQLGNAPLKLGKLHLTGASANLSTRAYAASGLSLENLGLSLAQFGGAPANLGKLQLADLAANLESGVCTIAQVSLANLALHPERVAGGAPLSLGKLQANGLAANPNTNTYAVGTLALSDAALRVERQTDGSVGLPGLKIGKSGADSGRQPSWKAGSVQLDNFRVEFADATVKSLLKLKIETMRAEGAESSLTRPIALNLRLGLNDAARVEFNGEVTPKPASARGRVALSDLALCDLTPWLPPQPLNLVKGRLRAAGEFAYAASGAPMFHFAGEAGLTDFAAQDQALDAQSLAFASLGAKGLNLDVQPTRATVEQITLDQGDILVRLGKDYALRVAGLDIPLSAAQKPKDKAPDKDRKAAQKDTSESPSIAVQRVEVRNTRLHFQDAGFTPPYTAELSGIELAVAPVEASKPAQIKFAARVNQTGRVQVSGWTYPFSKQVQLEMKAQGEGFDLTDASPYSKKFTGFPVVRGKLGFGLDYRIDRKLLDLKNELRLSKVELGKKVAVPGAMDVPLDLGLSLLQDGEGNVALSVPIKDESGQLNVGLAPVIGKAIAGFFGKILFSPFAFLNVAGNAGNTSFLAYAPGSVELSAAAKAQLVELSKAVAERPRLSLELVGLADRNADAPTLRLQSLRKRLPALAGEPGRDSTALGDEEYARLLRKAYEATYGKVQAASREQMEKSLSTKAPVLEEDWRDFARKRALQARAFLMETGKLPDGRIFIAERDPTSIPGAPGSRVELGLKY